MHEASDCNRKGELQLVVLVYRIDLWVVCARTFLPFIILISAYFQPHAYTKDIIQINPLDSRIAYEKNEMKIECYLDFNYNTMAKEFFAKPAAKEEEISASDLLNREEYAELLVKEYNFIAEKRGLQFIEDMAGAITSLSAHDTKKEIYAHYQTWLKDQKAELNKRRKPKYDKPKNDNRSRKPYPKHTLTDKKGHQAKPKPDRRSDSSTSDTIEEVPQMEEVQKTPSDEPIIDTPKVEVETSIEVIAETQ